jgi:glucose-1-phosphate adenylyltransferase
MLAGFRSTPVFILAGGVGERLAPLTIAKPKPAVSFGGTHQILDFTLSNCINSEMRRIFILTQYQRECLHRYVREIRLRIARKLRWCKGDCLAPLPAISGKRYGGTADAIFQNLPLVRSVTAEHVVVAAGDHVYSMDYRPFLAWHDTSGADLTVAAIRCPVAEASAFGVLEVEQDVVTHFREKPSREALPASGCVLVSMGIYAFKRSALLAIAERAISSETDLGRDIVPRLIRDQRVAAYNFGNSPRSYWRDVGSLDSYFEANMDLLGPRPRFEIDSRWPTFSLNDTSIDQTEDCRISRHAVVEASTIRHSIVSYGARIECGAVIENSVVLPGARVGKNAEVRNAIVADDANIPDGAQVGVNASLDRTRFGVTPRGVVVVSALVGQGRGLTSSSREMQSIAVA